MATEFHEWEKEMHEALGRIDSEDDDKHEEAMCRLDTLFGVFLCMLVHYVED
jgi:hypothetical protein